MAYIPDFLTKCLRQTQKSAARLVTLAKRDDHRWPVKLLEHWLKELRWPPVQECITHKVLLFTYKTS